VKLVVGCAGIVVVFYLWGAIVRALAPASNTDLTRFDAIIVLGSPADGDGNPSPTQLARVTEGVHEYERGVAPRLILTGGPAHNRFVEAQVMARTARAEGIPDSAIFVEGRAKDTVQNACYSTQIMKEHGWRSAEVVSSASHLRRAGLIFSRLPVEWRTHAAPMLEPQSAFAADEMGFIETLKTVHFLIWSRWVERCGT
jgi:uncharacterized SAM-binding protein YcdF (DUF218 family)